MAEWTASGIFFKDSVEVVAQEDPKVQGVTIFISGQRHHILKYCICDNSPQVRVQSDEVHLGHLRVAI